MTSIFSHTAASFATLIQKTLGKGKDHARLVYKEWFQKATTLGSDPHFANAKELHAHILKLTDFSLPLVEKTIDEEKTEKVFLKTHDDLLIEMVLLPMKAGWTACISSQIGCRMGCAFCQTGKMGLIRSLTTEEIVAQVFQAVHVLKTPIRNLVFMGMGEPFDNYENVMQAVSIISDPQGLNIAHRHITISTSGLVEKIRRFTKEAPPSLNLAISVNAPNDQIRRKLMPVNLDHDMKALRDAMDEYTQHPKRKVFIEYILMEGKTAALEDADLLASYLKGLKCTINLIPYNPQLRVVFQPPSKEAVDAFSERLKSHGFMVFVRGTKGQKIMAACGQLGRKKSFGFFRPEE